MQCVILAGGLGTRMRPFTEKMPKALIPVNGIPFLDHQLRHLKRSGVTNVLLSVCYMADQIRDYAGDGSKWGLKIEYVDDGQEPLGTAGALRLALDENKLDEAFLLTYGDSYLPISASDIFAFFQQGRSELLMTLFPNQDRWDKSNVVFESGRVKLYDKKQRSQSMHHIDYGMLAMRRAIAKEIPAGKKTDLSDLLHEMSKQGRISGIEVKERFYEIGSPEGLRDLEAYLEKA